MRNTNIIRDSGLWTCSHIVDILRGPKMLFFIFLAWVGSFKKDYISDERIIFVFVITIVFDTSYIACAAFIQTSAEAVNLNTSFICLFVFSSWGDRESYFSIQRTSRFPRRGFRSIEFIVVKVSFRIRSVTMTTGVWTRGASQITRDVDPMLF